MLAINLFAFFFFGLYVKVRPSCLLSFLSFVEAAGATLGVPESASLVERRERREGEAEACGRKKKERKAKGAVTL